MTQNKLWKMSPVLAALGLALAMSLASCDNPAGNGGETTPQFAISLSTTGHVFPSAHAGYTVGTGAGNVNPLTVTVANTGTQATGVLHLALSGTDFALSGDSIADIAVGGSQQFTVEPNAGLDFGSYSATVTITRAAGSMTLATLSVSFTVTNPAATQLAAPVISLNGSVVSWAAVTGATAYHVYAGNTFIGQTIETNFYLLTANPALQTGVAHQITVIAVGNPETHNPSLRSNAVSFTVAPPQRTLNLTGQVWQWGQTGLALFTGNIPNVTSPIGGSGAVTGGQLNFDIGVPTAGILQNLSVIFGEFGITDEMFDNFTVNPPEARGAILEGFTAPVNYWIYRTYQGDYTWEQVIYIFVQQNVTISGTGIIYTMDCDCWDCDCVEWGGECFCETEITTTSFNITLTTGWNPLLSRMAHTDDGGITVTISREHPAHLKWVLDEGPTDPSPGPGEPLVLYGPVWTLDEETGQSSQFTGTVQLMGTGSGAITGGLLSFSVPEPPSYWLREIADNDWLFPNATFTDNNAKSLILEAWSDDPSGGIARMHIESFSLQDQSMTAVFEMVEYIFVDRPVNVSSPGWNDSGTYDGFTWTETGSAFNITLNQGWNTVHQRIVVSMSETTASMNTTSTTIANPGHMRWYWQEWDGDWGDGDWWCGCDDGDCQYWRDCVFCESGWDCGSPNCHCTTGNRYFGEGTNERLMRAAPGRSRLPALRNMLRTFEPR